jgi:anaerobic ribonucleoside-triphosphate reductase
MDEADVFNPEALEAHRGGGIFIHLLEKSRLGYSTGVDLGRLIDAALRNTLDDYLAEVIETVKRLRGEWAHSVTLHGLEAGIAEVLGEAGYTDDQTRESIFSFINEINQTRFRVTLSLNETSEPHMFKQMLADQLEASASQGHMNIDIAYNVTSDTDLSKEPHKEYVSLAFKHGNVEFQGETPIKRTGILGDPWDGGRLGVVTLNLPRLGYEARNEEDFYARLGHLTELAVEALEDKRRAVEEFLEAGYLPYTRQLHGSLEGHASVVTLAGVNEAVMNLIDAGVSHVAGKAVTYKVLEFMWGQLREAQSTTGHTYSLEAYPCMEAGVVFAAEDQRLDDIFTQGESSPYYTAAAELPPSHGDDLWWAMDHLKKMQSIFTGGTTQEVHLQEGLEYRDECGVLIKQIMRQGYPNVKPSPLFSLCPNHGYLPGEAEECPGCGEPPTVYTWVDGYPRALVLLSDGLKEAHRQRVSHDVKSR